MLHHHLELLVGVGVEVGVAVGVRRLGTFLALSEPQQEDIMYGMYMYVVLL